MMRKDEEEEEEEKTADFFLLGRSGQVILSWSCLQRFGYKSFHKFRVLVDFFPTGRFPGIEHAC